jgi:hypothetical protein
VTGCDDHFFDQGKKRPRKPFVPIFCPLKNLDRVNADEDLVCINCGAQFPIGTKDPKHNRNDVDNCNYIPDLR